MSRQMMRYMLTFFIVAAALLVMLGLVPKMAYSQSRNIPVTLLPSAARTAATVNTTDQTNDTWNRLHVIVNVSAYTGGNYTPKIQGKDPVSGSYYDLCVGTAIASTGVTVLKIGPGFVAVANQICGDMLPRVWRLSIAGAATPSMTFSVGAFLGE